jgi:hypothetical protein
VRPIRANGKALLAVRDGKPERMVGVARDTGIRRIAAVMLAGNEPARRLVLRIARRLSGDEPAVVDGGIHDGVREVTVELAG